MVIKTGLSSFSSAINAVNSNATALNVLKPKVGRVFGVTTTTNTPTVKQFVFETETTIYFAYILIIFKHFLCVV